MCKKPMISGIICEYNPFHNGHRTLIQAIRQSGSTHIVAVMSGNFVQRGEPACLEKGTRIQMALQGGADLVLELPVPWAAARAETFAYGGVYLLEQFGCVDRLAFGSEHGQIAELEKLADRLLSPGFEPAVSQEASAGVPFARARQAAVAKLCGKETAALLEHPNNILGVEYCKALRQLGSSIRPQTVQRTGSGHHDTMPDSRYASAGYLRARLAEDPSAELSAYMPHGAFDLLRADVQAGHLSSMGRMETAILAHLRTLTPETLSQLPDISEGLENRLWQGIRQAATLDELYQFIKSKRYSHARIRRIILSAFLGLRAEDTVEPPPYLRVLGMNSRGMEILHHAKHTARLPILTRYAQIKSQNGQGKHIFSLECRATDLYTLSFAHPQACGLEQNRKMIVLHTPTSPSLQ